MALAIKFQDMLDRREVRDYAELARLGYVSRARITQIMNLLNLAPDIQQELVFQGGAHRGRRQISEHELRIVASEFLWTTQRSRWHGLGA
jgi:hypothetical protein